MNLMFSVNLNPLVDPFRPALRTLRRLPAWAWLLLIAVPLRFVNLGSESIWYDESFTLWLAKLDLGHMFAAITGDVHPPLWYLVEWVNIRLFGTSEFTLRLPAAVFGVLSVLLVWRLATLIHFEPRTAFTAGLLAALLPSALYYSQDARMYPLLTFCVLWAAISLVKGKWHYFVLASVGAIYTQNLGAFYVAALGIAAVIVRTKAHADLKRPALAALAITVLWSPWLPTLLHQMQAVKSGFWIQPLTPGGVLFPLPTMTLGWRLPPSLQMHVYVAAFALSIGGLLAARRWLLTGQGVIIVALVLGAPALVAVASLAFRSVYLPRAFLPSAFGLMLLWAYALNHLGRPNRLAALAVLTPALAAGMFFHYWPASGQRFPVRDWAAPVRAGWQADDVIYHIAIDSYISFAAYTSDLPAALLPYTSDLNQSLTEDTKAAMQMVRTPFDDLAKQGYRRAWLIVSVNPLTSSDELAALERIKASHSYQVIKSFDNGYASEVILLVTL